MRQGYSGQHGREELPTDPLWAPVGVDPMKCKLCGQEAELRDSHVIPEFLYEPLYDKKHRYHVVSNVHGKSRRPEQKGLRERMLCAACETRLSGWETYAANALYHRKKPGSERPGDEIRMEGLDYAKFKLFGLSLLWRAAVSSLPVFRETELGPHESKIRAMLVSGDPGPQDKYGCLVFAVTLQGRPLDGAIYGPQPCRIGSHHAYRLLVRSILFVYLVSSHRPDDHARNYFLTEQGRLIIPVKELQDIPFLDSLCREIAKATRNQGI